MPESDKLKGLLANSERVGVIGSPSSTAKLMLDILGRTADKKLVGAFAIMEYTQDTKDHYGLGQITEISLKNIWSEDPTMRGLIRQKGVVSPITEKQDTHTADMIVSAVFARATTGFEPSMLGTVPPTGTWINLVDDDIINELLASCKDELFYLGRMYASKPLLPMWFKHFDKKEGGLGEAYHIGIFGKTGSGKSVLAKMILLGYARNNSMSLFVMDPQGEFSDEFRGESDFKKVLTEKLSRTVEVCDLHNLTLTGDNLFKKVLLMSGFFDELKIFRLENKIHAVDVVLKILKTHKIDPWKFYERRAFDIIWAEIILDKNISKIYKGKKYQDELRAEVETSDVEEMYKYWFKISNLFGYTGRGKPVKIKDLVGKITEEKGGPLIIVNLSREDVPRDLFWNDDIKLVVINEFLSRLASHAEEIYRQGKKLNCLVVIDEAHKLAPAAVEKEDEELARIKKGLIDNVRTTRKYGLGWMFISQTLSSLDKEIINQLRIQIFGFGLGWGVELRALQNIIGGNPQAIKLYQLFRDPQSTPTKKEYPFMAIGPISPLSFSSVPLFFNALQFPSEFLRKNKL